MRICQREFEEFDRLTFAMERKKTGTGEKTQKMIMYQKYKFLNIRYCKFKKQMEYDRQARNANMIAGKLQDMIIF